MLVFGDIHINQRYQHDILDTLTQHIAQFPDEKNILFLGDYVYHFSYDRAALLGLYQLWIDLFKQGKSLFILAGNHDRIGQYFVFQEAQRAFEIIRDVDSEDGSITFITEPLLTTIEGQDILFFPFSLDYASVEDPLVGGVVSDDIINTILDETKSLSQKKHKNFHISADINRLLLRYLTTYQGENLLVVHHHYFDEVNFPSQHARFSFKHIALSKHFLELSKCRFLSGHLHQNFSYKNYLCVGSVWNTSSLETNQIKGYYCMKNDNWSFTPLWINPNFLCELNEHQKFSAEILDAIIAKMWKDFSVTIQQSDRFGTIVLNKDLSLPLKNTHCTLVTDHIDYQDIDRYVDPDLRIQLKDIKLKKTTTQSFDIKQLSTLYDRDTMDSFSDWKNLLRDFLKNTYPTEYKQYEEFLIQHTIL